jgi:Rnl2 family RNA ligase
LCIDLARLVVEQKRDAKLVCIFGELFGGSYPNNDNNNDNDNDDNNDDTIVEPVQREILYCAELRFCAFDVMVDGQFVEWMKAASWLDSVGMDWSRPLYVGSFADCVSFNNEFESTLPALLGNTPLDNNYAEGIVVKPVHKMAMVETSKGAVRAILKSKPRRFAESVESYRRAQTAGGHGEADMRMELLAFVTQTRAAAAVSKHGRGGARRVLIDELRRDALADALADAGRAARWSALTAAARARIVDDIALASTALFSPNK